MEEEVSSANSGRSDLRELPCRFQELEITTQRFMRPHLLR
jgi:hypothetical protein